MEWMIGYSEVMRILVEYGRMLGLICEVVRRLIFFIVRVWVKSSYSDEV